MKDRIRELMEAQHMNQQTFANCIGINTATLSGILTGKTQPTIKVVNAIMRKFPNININWLMFGQGGMLTGKVSTPTPQPSITDTNEDTSLQNSHSSQQSPSLFSELAPMRNSDYHTENSTPNTSVINGDNLAVTPSFFDEQQQRQTSTFRQQVHQNNLQVFQQNQPTSTPVVQPSVSIRTQIEQSDSPTLPKRRVTEIRVFYDDQTWEAFVPKK